MVSNNFVENRWGLLEQLSNLCPTDGWFANQYLSLMPKTD